MYSTVCVKCGYLSGAKCKWLACGPADGTATPWSLASLKYRRGSAILVPAFFTQVVLEERPLNGCHSSWKVSYQQKHNHCIIVQCNDTSMASRWHQVSKFRRSRIQIIMNLLQHEAQVFSAFYDHWFFFISWGQLTPCPEMMNRHSHFGNGGF